MIFLLHYILQFITPICKINLDRNSHLCWAQINYHICLKGTNINDLYTSYYKRACNDRGFLQRRYKSYRYSRSSWKIKTDNLHCHQLSERGDSAYDYYKRYKVNNERCGRNKTNLSQAEKDFIQTHLDLSWSLDVIKGAYPDRISCSMRTLYRLADRGIFKKQNLLRLDEKEVNHLIKYAMFDKEQKRGYKQSTRNLANWHYDDKEDSYTHPDGWSYRFHHIKHQKTQTDFQQEIKVYYADEPEVAPQKGLYMNERYQHLKAKECQALLSPQGRQIFAQRNIDVEPVFGQIKACLGYKR